MMERAVSQNLSKMLGTGTGEAHQIAGLLLSLTVSHCFSLSLTLLALVLALVLSLVLSTPSFTYFFTHSFTNLLTYSLIHSLTHRLRPESGRSKNHRRTAGQSIETRCRHTNQESAGRSQSTARSRPWRPWTRTGTRTGSFR